MKLVAVLACRNQSSRLYAKPLQNLDVGAKVTILDYLVAQIRLNPVIKDIVLAISEQKENDIYQDMAKNYGASYIRGDDHDVLSRLIRGGESAGADNILRVTTESPYIYYELLEDIYKSHCDNNIDYSTVYGIPDGSSFEIIKLEALKKAWDLGSSKHRSEFCCSYILENPDKFKIAKHEASEDLKRGDMRLTVDWPEDLIVMRQIYQNLGLKPEEPLDFKKIIDFLDKTPEVNSINNWIDSGIGRSGT